MARHKNKEWNLDGKEVNGRSSGVSPEHLHAALLMDLRDELQRLNRLLHCHNTVAIPELLRAIKRNTTKRKRKVSKP